MRRSARISARKGGRAISKTENEAQEETRSEDLPAVSVVVTRERSRRKTVKTPKVIEAVRRSTRKNLVKYLRDENDSNSLGNKEGDVLSEIESKTKESKRVETYEEVPSDVVDNIDNLRESNEAFEKTEDESKAQSSCDVVDNIDNLRESNEAFEETEDENKAQSSRDVLDTIDNLRESNEAFEETEGEDKVQSFRDEDKKMLQPTRKSKAKRRSRVGKKNAGKEEKNTGKSPEKQQDPSLSQQNEFEMEIKDSHENAGFVIISKEEIDLGNTTEDGLINDNVLKGRKIDEKANELFENKPSMNDEEQDNEFSLSNTNVDCSRTDDSTGISHQAISTCNQSSIHDVSVENKFKKIQNIGKLGISQSFLQSDSIKRNLLKLTSEVFQKIPFKITKETLMTNKVPKGNGVKFSERSNKLSPDEHILQQDIISVTVDETKIADKKKEKFTLSSELDPRVKSNELYLKIDQHGSAPALGNFGKSGKEEKKILKRSVIGSDFEQKECSITHESKRQKMKRRKQKSEETAGKGWYNLPKTEMTNEIKRDLQVIKMRNVLDPKRFYKRGDRKMSKYVLFVLLHSGADKRVLIKQAHYILIRPLPETQAIAHGRAK